MREPGDAAPARTDTAPARHGKRKFLPALEAIGDFAGLNALTPNYLKQLGLIDKVPGPEADIPYLLRMALDKVAFLPFAVIVDKWRWQVFGGETADTVSTAPEAAPPRRVYRE
jgi:hypothetical protein